MSEWLEFKSKWENKCLNCEQTILIGSPIMWNKESKKVVHKHCFSSETKEYKWKRIRCPNCFKEVIHNVNHTNYDPKSLCTECLEEKHELYDK